MWRTALPVSDPVLLGDTLADFVDGGGVVVVCGFTCTSPIMGRLQTMLPWTGGVQGGLRQMLVLNTPSHPLALGIGTFSVLGGYCSGFALDSNPIPRGVVATYAGSLPAVAYRGRVVAYEFCFDASFNRLIVWLF